MRSKRFVELAYWAQIMAVIMLPLALCYWVGSNGLYLTREMANWWFGHEEDSDG